MAKKVVRTHSKEDIQAGIAEAKRSGEGILRMPTTSAAELDELRSRYLSWQTHTSAFLDSRFHSDSMWTQTPRGEFVTASSAGLVLPLKLSADLLSAEEALLVKQDIKEKLRVLSSIVDRLDFFEGENIVDTSTVTEAPDGPIFLVHGHDTGLREQVRRFLERATGRKVVVLADEPNQGQDLLGKLLAQATSASYAVVLLTPDDEGNNEALRVWCRFSCESERIGLWQESIRRSSGIGLFGWRWIG